MLIARGDPLACSADPSMDRAYWDAGCSIPAQVVAAENHDLFHHQLVTALTLGPRLSRSFFACFDGIQLVV